MSVLMNKRSKEKRQKQIIDDLRKKLKKENVAWFIQKCHEREQKIYLTLN